MTTLGRPIAFLNWNDQPVLEFRHSTGYQVQNTRIVLRSREELDGFIATLQALSADMKTREPK